MAQEKRIRSVKERVFWFLYKILKAVVGLLVRAKIVKKRRVETIIVE
jgi:hypothetical protein